MKSKLKLAAIMLSASLALSACNPWGERVEVPPASVGMILGASGYQGDIIPPSRFRLSPCFRLCDKLVVIEAGDIGKVEAMEVLMPQDNMFLGVDVRFTLAISDNKTEILRVFDRIVPRRLDSGNFGVTIEDVYSVYGEAVVRNIVRSSLSEMTISEVQNNQGSVSEILRTDVSEALSRTPLEVKQFGLADIRFPPVVRQAMEATQERRIAIERAEADAQVQIREAQARLEVTRAEREADLLEAQTVAEANKILADGVTPELLEYRRWQVIEKMSQNKNTVFFPVEMLGAPGLDYRVLQQGNN
jgi:regulator of protease activity HflC (stomatin/prohibitin superfamily)